MTNKQTILCVDDEPTNQFILEEVLSGRYDLHIVGSGEECLSHLENNSPNMILMDVSMPGMNGLEACKLLKLMPNGATIPVIFISALVSEDDRIAGYEAGGDDYVTKPFSGKELISKIELILEQHSEVKKIKMSAEDAFKTAMTSMANSGELGVVIDVLKNSFRSKNTKDLAQLALNTINSYGHGGCVLLRCTGSRQVFMTNDDSKSDVEKKVLERAKDGGRIVEFSSRLIFNAGSVSLLLRDVDINADFTGRLKDHLAMIAEGLDARIDSIKTSLMLTNKTQINDSAQLMAFSMLQDLKDLYQVQKRSSSEVVSKLVTNMEAMYSNLALSDGQETRISEELLQADLSMDKLYDNGLGLDEKFKEIIDQLSANDVE